MNLFLTQGADPAQSGSLISLLGMVAVFGVLIYFFILRPQKKQEKEANDLRNSLGIGDEVTTIGGIIGRVVSIKDETFTLETSRDRTKIRFLRSAIKSVDVKVADLRAAEAAEEKPAEAVEEKPAKKAKKDAE